LAPVTIAVLPSSGLLPVMMVFPWLAFPIQFPVGLSW